MGDKPSHAIKFRAGSQLMGYGFYCDITGEIGLIICPVCKKKNPITKVLKGRCHWCGFIPGEEEIVVVDT